MAAIASLRRALGALAGSPVLFLGGLALGLVLLPQSAAQLAGVPLVPTLLQVLTFFVTPFVVAGLIGMADEALEDGTAFSTLTTVGRERYVPLLFGNLIQFAIAAVFGIVVAIVAVVFAVVVGVSAVGAAGGFNPAAVGGGVVVLAVVVFGVLLLAYLLVAFVIQFYSVAIVVDELGAIDGFRRSYRVVRSNLLPTLGFSLINLAVSVVSAVPVTGLVLWRTLDRLDSIGAGPAPGPGPTPGFGMAADLFTTTEAVAISVVSLAVTMVLATFFRTYATAFYRDHRTEPGAV
jgi:hypothetical protein